MWELLSDLVSRIEESVQQIGRYQVCRELGRGGMTIVYQAHDPRFDHQVAFKLLPKHFTHDPEILTRFQKEAQIIASLEHPAIVPVYDYGDREDSRYQVMRYMAGGSLQERLKNGRLPLAEVSRIMDRLAPAGSQFSHLL